MSMTMAALAPLVSATANTNAAKTQHKGRMTGPGDRARAAAYRIKGAKKALNRTTSKRATAINKTSR